MARLRLAAALMTAAAMSACSENLAKSSSPTSPGSPAPRSVSGTVRYGGVSPVAGVLVEVIDGVSAGATTLTDSQGNYRFDFTSGTARLRWSKRGYATIVSDLLRVGDAELVIHQSLKTEWVVSGRLTAHDGTPVDNADLNLFVESNGESYSGWGETDRSGGFRIVTAALPDDGYVLVNRYQYLREKFPFACRPTELPAGICDGRTEVTLTARMTRVTGVTLILPASLRVGETAPVRREIRLDDGRVLEDHGYNPHQSSGSFGNEVSSQNPAIADIVKGSTGGIVRVQGLAPGTTTIVTTFSGVRATTIIRVE